MSILVGGFQLRCAQVSSSLCVHFTVTPRSSWSSFCHSLICVWDCGVSALLTSPPQSPPSVDSLPPPCHPVCPPPLYISSCISQLKLCRCVCGDFNLPLSLFRTHIINQIKAELVEKKHINSLIMFI